MAALNIADKAIANAALTELLMMAFDESTGDRNPQTAVLVADELVTRASRVQFRPSTRQIVLTFDLAFGTPDQT